MKLLSLSGGGTKIAALTGAAITLKQKFNYKPDFIIGSSAGGILALPLAMDLDSKLKEIILNLKLKDIFNIKPINKKGNIRFFPLLRVLFGYESFGKQDNLCKTLKKLIPENLFNVYKKSNTYPEVFIGSVDFKSGGRTYFRVKDLTYQDYLKVVQATSSIPLLVESVNIGDKTYYDCGVRDHMPSHWALENLIITENISIYSRPENYNMINLNWKPTNIIKVLNRTLDIMMTEISKNDELQEDSICKEKGIKNTKIFMPYVLSDNPYDLNKKKLKEWYEIGKESTLKYMKKAVN